MEGTSKLPERERNPIVKKLFETHTINTVSDIYDAYEKDCGQLSYSDRGMIESMIDDWYESGEIDINGHSVTYNKKLSPKTIVVFSSGFRTY